jgi:hypothetical protein
MIIIEIMTVQPNRISFTNVAARSLVPNTHRVSRRWPTHVNHSNRSQFELRLTVYKLTEVSY